MAGTLSFSGISVSGLDTSGWVDALVSVKQQTITSLEQQKEEQEKLLDVVNNIKTFFSSFQSCLSKITDSQFGIPTMDLFLQNLAISSNTNIATATATTEAARQSYDVLVDSLATSTKATSGHVIYEEIFATMDTKIGLLGAKNGTITVNSQAFSVTTEDTIRDLISKFQQVGVSAKFDEEKGTFTVGVSLSEIDEGATGIKSALKLKDNTVSGAVSGSLVYATRDTEFSKLGLTAGKVVIEGIEHTISKNGDSYTITPNGGNTYALNTVGHFLDYLKVTLNAEYADIDNIGNITIKGATLDKVNGGSNLLDVLNLSETTDRLVMESSKLTYNQNHVADLTTELSSLGITNTTTLTVGGTTHNITSDKTLGDVKDLLKAGGVDFAIDKDGVITINTNGNEISGTLLDALGLDASKGGTTITSSAHTSRYDADGNTLLSELGITDSMKYVAYKSDGTALTGEISGLSGKTLNEFVSDLKAKGLNASFDSTTHQIIIDDGYIEGTLADALGMSSEITKYTEAATLDTTLEKLGATGNQTLSIDGGASKSYGKDTKLSTVIDDIKAAGGEVNFKDGNLEIKGVTLGGTLPTLLGLDATTQGSSVTSSALTVVTGADSSGSGMTETVEHDITLDSKIGDILGTTIDYTLKVGDGNTVTYTKDTTLASLKNQIESAGGTFKINDDNTITIDDVTMSGTLVGALGFDSVEDGTRFSTVNPVMVVGTTNVANGSTALGSLGSGIATFAAPTTYSLSINGGTAKNYDAGATLDQIFADIEAAGGTAEIDSEGYIVIEGVELEGTLLDKLGLEVTSYKTTITSGNLEVTTSTTSTSSSVLYGEDGGDITWDSTIGSIVGDTNSYSLIVNGTNKNFATIAKLSDVKSAVEAAGGTMTINSDNTISIDGVEISGTLFDVLGFVTTDYDTVISSNNPIYAKGEDKEATSSTKFSELGIADNLRDYAIYKNDGTVIKVSSTTNTTGDSTIGDWLNTLNTQLNAANGTSGKTYAKIENGVISITGGYITGSLPTALGIRTETVVTGGSVSGGSISYVEYEPLKYISGVDLGVGESSTDITSTGTIGSSVNQSGTAAENTTSTGSIGVNGTQGGNAEGDMSSTGLIGTSINQSGTASSDISSSGLIGPEDEFVDLFGNITDATLDATLAELLTPGASDPLNNDARLPASSYTLKIGSYATKTFNSSTTTLRDVINYIENLKTYDPTYDMAFDAYLSGDKLVIKTDTEVTGTLADVLGLTKVKTEDEYYTYVAKSVKYTDLVEGGSNGYNFSITGSGKIEYDTTTTVASGGYEFTGEAVTYSKEVETTTTGSFSYVKVFDVLNVNHNIQIFDYQITADTTIYDVVKHFNTGLGPDFVKEFVWDESYLEFVLLDGRTPDGNIWSDIGVTPHTNDVSGQFGSSSSATAYSYDMSSFQSNYELPTETTTTTETKTLSQYTKISELFDGSTATQTLKLQVAGGAEESLTFNSTDSVQTIIDKLKDKGINASVSSDGKFTVTSDERWTLSGALASKLFGGSGNEVYTYVGTKVTYTETIITPGDLTSDGFINTPGNHTGSASSGGTVTIGSNGFINTPTIVDGGSSVTSTPSTYVQSAISVGPVSYGFPDSSTKLVDIFGSDIIGKWIQLTSTSGGGHSNEAIDPGLGGSGTRPGWLPPTTSIISHTPAGNDTKKITIDANTTLADLNKYVSHVGSINYNNNTGEITITTTKYTDGCGATVTGDLFTYLTNKLGSPTIDIDNQMTPEAYTKTTTVYTLERSLSEDTYVTTTSKTLGDLRILALNGQYDFVVTKEDGTSQTFNYSSSNTIQDVFDDLASIGITATMDSSGNITYSAGFDWAASGNVANKIASNVDGSFAGVSSGSSTTSGATYVGSTVKTQAVAGTGYSSSTKINDFLSRAVGTRIYVKSDDYTGSTTGFVGQSYNFQYLDITSSTTIQNVVDFFNTSAGVRSASYSQSTGELTLDISNGFTINSGVFLISMDDCQLADGTHSTPYTRTIMFGKTGGSPATTATTSTQISKLGLFLTSGLGFSVLNNGTTTDLSFSNSDTISTVVSKLNAIDGVTATFSDGKLTVNSQYTDLAFSANLMQQNFLNKIFGGSVPTPTITEAPTSGSKVYVSSLSDFVSGDTYYLKEAADLNKLAQLVNSGKNTAGVTFILEDNIDMSSVTNFAGIGNSLTNNFKGTFQGNGHVIKNLKMNSSNSYVGLFAYVNDATIEDLGLENVNITSTFSGGGTFTGALVGMASGVNINNSFVNGGTINSSTMGTGGLVGYAKNIQIKNSYSQVDIIIPDSATSSSGYYGGGLIGNVEATSVEITKSYSASNISGGVGYAGGLIGGATNLTSINITDAYSVGNISSTRSDSIVGGIIGNLLLTDSSSSSITRVYSASQTLTGNTVGGFIGKSNTFTGIFNFCVFNVDACANATSSGDLNGALSSVNGCTLNVIKNQTNMQNWGFTAANGWQYTTGSTPHFGNMSGSAGSTTTTTHDATLNTTVSKLFGDSASHTLTVDGTDITFSSTDNISDILNKLWSDKKIYGTMENGVISLDSNDDHVLTGDLAQKLFGSATVDLQGSNGGASDKYTMERSEDGSASTTVTTTHTLAADTYIGDLFGDSSNHTFTVNGEDITLGPDKTIQDLINALAGKGVTMTITDGKVFLGSNDLGEFTVSGDLANKILGRSGTINGDCVTQEVTLSTSSKIKDIFWDNDTHYFKINKASGGTVSISLSGNDTIQTLIDKLQNNGIVATIDSSGKMTFKSNYKWTASGDLADIITGSSSMSMSTTYLYTYETEELEVYTGHQFVSQMLNSGQTLIKGFRYHIATIDDLKALATFVNNRGLDTTDIDFVLDGNITLNSSFVSIGTSSNAFKGNFYGNGNTISGAQKTIFAYTSGAEIRDVGVINANVSGGDNTGILVGKGSSTKITNTYVTGSVSGGSNTGALAGSLTGSTVTDSYSTATVSGSSNVGGLVGSTTTTNITRAYATGDVTASGSKVGGFVGNHASGTITAAYATGNVKGNSTVGGFVGANAGTISNAYSTSRVYGTTNGAFAGSNSGTFSGNVYNSNLEIAGVGSGSSSGLTAKTFVDMQNQSIMESLGFTAAKGWKYTQYNTPYLGTITTDVSGGTRRVSQVSEFRAGDTYYINDVTDLNALSTFLKNGADTTGVTFILNNDIDMSGVSNFTPIGSATNTFKGDFYGNGHTISNLKVSTSSANAGLFGVIEDSHIQDVCINGVSVSGGSNTGALVGQVTGTSTIKNISVKGGTVTGSGNNLGGLIGSLSSNSTLTESYTALTVQSSSSISNVGGLIGNNNGTVSKTYTDGEVKASSATNVGGLIGTNSGKVSTSYVMRNVTGATNVGGFIGTNSGNVSNSYSIADVSGSVSGGFIGKNNGGTLSGNVYNIGSGDAVVNAQGVGSGSSTGINGLVIEDMRKKDVMEAQGFTSSNGWSYLNYVTPVLGGVTATGGGKIYVDSSLTEFEIGDTYYINSAAQLKRLAEMVNAGHDTAGIVFVLENDITLDSSFTSIGTSTEMFKGDFYGNGHTISGAQDTIFAYTHNAKIQDVGVINANVSGGDNTGILVGYGEHNTEIINSYVNGSVSGSNNVGGLAGALVDSTVINSFSNAVVNGANTVGGLLGKVTNTTVKSSYATGDVTASGNTAGGFIGQLVSGSITTAYAEGNVLASSNVGGFVGTNGGTISNAYSIGRVHGNNRGAFAGTNNGTMTGNVYNSNLEINATGTGSTSGITGKTFVEMQNQSIMESLGFTSDKGWKYISNLIAPVLNGVGKIDDDGIVYVKELSEFKAGDTYYIKDAADLKKLSELVNAGEDTTGTVFILEGDIDMSGVSNFTPIGSATNTFKGDFYGNGHTISNLKINTTSDPNIKETGLFGYLEKAVIRDLAITDATVSGNGKTGILAGYADADTVIENSYTTGSVTSSGDGTGGFIGINYGTIKKSYTTAKVSGQNDTGGFVGYNYGTISSAYATGDVVGKNNSGGFAGSNKGTITTAYSIGQVESTGSQVGGFVGYAVTGSNISNVFTASHADGVSNVGGFAGKADSGVTFTGDVYNTSTNLGAVGSGTSTGITGLEYKKIWIQSEMEALGFTADKGWLYSENTTPYLNTNSTLTNSTGKVYVSQVDSFISGEVFYIATKADLQKLAELVNNGALTDGVSFVLENDIDASGVASIGNSEANAFNGVFYGNGNKITGLTNSLFGYTEEAFIRDVAVDVNISGSGSNVGALIAKDLGGSEINNSYSTGTISGNTNVGGLVGYLGSGSQVKNSYSEAKVTAATNAAGLVGVAEDAEIINSFSTGTVKATSSYAGGLVGRLNSGSVIDNSYSLSNVTSGNISGGLVGGVSSSTIKNSYSAGTVSGTGAKGFVGRTEGSNTISGNVYNKATTDSISGATGLTLDQLKHQATMESYGFTADRGWSYYEDETPTLKAKNYSGTGYDVDVTLDTTLERLGDTLISKDITVKVGNNTYQKDFKDTDTVSDVVNWLNSLSGVTASFDERNSQITISTDAGELSVTGGLANMLFGGYGSTSTTTITVNTDSSYVVAEGQNEKITEATTVKQLLKSNNAASIGFADENGQIVMETFEADQTLGEVKAFLEANGFDVKIENGVFTATKEGGAATDLYGAIGSALKGEVGTTTVTPSGYDSDILSSATSFVADKTTTLEKLGINSGNIHIKDSFGNIINSITIDNQMTVNDVAALLNNYGFTLDIVNGKVTVTGEGTNKIVDGTSNMVSKMKLDNWTSNKDKLTNTSTVAEMGFSTGASLGVSSPGKFMPDLNFNANDTLDTIIARLKNYGITASVDSNGKFTASADFSFVLTGELGVYLTQNSANGYEQIANGYKSENPLEFNKPVTELTEDTLIGELLGTGEGGVLRLTIDENDVYDLKYNANDTVSDIMADLAAYGITTKIENGVLTAVSLDRTFRFSGDIGDAISGRTPTYEDISTGYISKDLSYKTTGVANIDSTMKELGILSGEIHVLDNSGNILRTLSIDETFTVSQIKSMLVPYGFNMNIDSQGKISVTSSEGYTLSDGTSNMVSKMGITHWNKNEEKLSLTTTISEMGFKNGADLNLFLDGLTQNILSFDADETLQDVIFALSAYGIDASVNSNGVFTAESKEHTFIMSSSLGSFLTKGTAGYVNRDTGYQTYKPLEEEKDYYVNSTKNLDYNELMTEDSTLSSLGFENGGNVIVRLDDNTNYTLSFLGTDKISDVIFALSAYGINAEVNAEGKFVAESVDNQFVMAGNLGNFLLSGGNYYNETTGYISEPLNYDTVEKVDLSTKLTDLGVLKGDVNILKNGIPFATISITDETTVGQLFSAIKVYGIEGSIKTDDAGNTYIELASDSTIRLADGTSNVVSALNFTDIRQGDFNGNVIYWDDDASSGLITGDMKLSDFDKNGYIAQGSLIFETGTGDSAVEHIINISADETVNSLLKKFNDAGITATLENGLLKIHSGIDGITFKGGTSGLINTMSLDIDDIDTYASSDSALSYNGDVGYSSANFADAGTLLSTVNVTEGQMNIFIDGIKCTVQVNTTDTFADLFSKISAVTAARTGVTVKVGFLDRDGNIVTNPTATNNTGIIAIEAAEGHELVIGSSIDTTNFATIANLNKTGYSSIKGSRALYKVNSDSLITGTGLFRAGDVTEGTFKIGDAEFTIDSTTTINQLMEQINKSEKAYATAYWDTLSGRMVIESTLTGASLINIEAGTSNFTDIMGFTTVKDGEKALVTDTQKLGKNAIIRINGTTITSASNVITSDISKIKGLTINLKGLSQGETTTITVEQDDESIYNAVAETLDAYNAMMEALNKELENKDSLGSDPLVKLMRNQLKRLMTSSLVGDYVFKNLAAIGISTGEASDSISTNVTSLLIDKDQFMNALDIDSDAVKELLVGTTTNPGIFLQASNIVNSAVNSGGYFTNLAESLTRSITKTEQKISSVSQDIENYKLRLERNFQNMETAISSLQNSYSNFLSKVKI